MSRHQTPRAGSFLEPLLSISRFRGAHPAGGTTGPGTRHRLVRRLLVLSRARRRRYCPERRDSHSIDFSGPFECRPFTGTPRTDRNVYERFLQGRQPNRSSRRTFFIPPRAFRQRESLGGEDARSHARKKPRTTSRIHHNFRLSDPPPLHACRSSRLEPRARPRLSR